MRFLILSLIVMTTSLAYADHGQGGGSYVVIDGDVRLADPYYAGTPAKDIHQIIPITFTELPKELQAYTIQLLDYIKKQGLESDELKNSVLGGAYFYVPTERENNVPCDHYLPTLNRPVDDHFQYGCTLSQQTYLFQKKFEVAPIREEAKALIHERLWAKNNHFDQKDISVFTTLLGNLYKKYTQQVEKKDRKPLSDDEISNIKNFFAVAKKLNVMPVRGFDGLAPNQITANGGLVSTFCENKINITNSFLGLGSIVDCRYDSKNAQAVIRNSTVIGTRLYDITEIDNSEIIYSNIMGTTLKNMNVNNSTLSGYSTSGYKTIFRRKDPVSVSTYVNGVIKDSLLIAKSFVQATESNPFSILSTTLAVKNMFIADEGLKLDHFFINGGEINSSRVNEDVSASVVRLFDIRIGKNVSLEKLNIKVVFGHPDGSYSETERLYGVAPFEFAVSSNTQVQNGDLLLLKYYRVDLNPDLDDYFDHLTKSEWAFNLGNKNAPLSLDLHGKGVKANWSSWLDHDQTYP